MEASRLPQFYAARSPNDAWLSMEGIVQKAIHRMKVGSFEYNDNVIRACDRGDAGYTLCYF